MVKIENIKSRSFTIPVHETEESLVLTYTDAECHAGKTSRVEVYDTECGPVVGFEGLCGKRVDIRFGCLIGMLLEGLRHQFPEQAEDFENAYEGLMEAVFTATHEPAAEVQQ